ncbi:MAG: diguanylate cyclase [Acidobacteriota bacterium]
MTAPKSPSGTLPLAGRGGGAASQGAEGRRPEPSPRSLSRLLRLLYAALAAGPLLLAAAALAALGATPPQIYGLLAVGLISLAAAVGLASRHARCGRGWLERLTVQCRAIDEERWRYRPDGLRAETEMPAEFRRLYEQFDRMAFRLDGSMAQLRSSVSVGEELRRELEEVLQSREEEVRSRTAELQVANLHLERLAREDGLTGIANHRHFVEFTHQVWRIAIREEKPVAVLMIDVDHFKAFNDIYGHQAGDQCLKKVSASIASVCRRPLDLAARYGGEEFAVVLGDTEIEGAFQLAEQARLKVAGLDIVHSGSVDYGVVTISLGVACLLPHRDTEATTLISLADKALYRAKKSGRNRTSR